MPDADYFSAADDEAALAVVEAGGPARAGLDVIFLKDIDPVDAIAQLEAIMTDCGYEEAGKRPGWRTWEVTARYRMGGTQGGPRH